jgi:2-amino-4-hydroxy-6-hydroxymethyldihydropteridine diphosphokinase
MRHGYLGLGSNLGDRQGHLRLALERLRDHGVDVDACSSVWETEAIDGAGPSPFLNMVVRVRFDCAPDELLRRLQHIERLGGRVRDRPNAPRKIDLDILWIDGLRLSGPELHVPHPRMWDRAFVLAPLGELAPELRDPGTGKTVEQLLATAAGGVRNAGSLSGASAGKIGGR